ncbi:hypothetical protein HanHA89_Chr02g0040591 [Helianthus annuus]|nr:hypothetical protein HanHA89_Chr02g0040591 [Helianthus annuus]
MIHFTKHYGFCFFIRYVSLSSVVFDLNHFSHSHLKIYVIVVMSYDTIGLASPISSVLRLKFKVN